MAFWQWSRTAASNSTADSTVNMAEGMAPSAVDDGVRALMASTAKYRDDIAGAIATGGTSTAYTVTSYQVFDTLAHMDGAMIAFTPHASNGGTCTLNVDGLGAKALRSAPSVELPAGTLILGTPYVATYYNATTEWILHNFSGSSFNIPLGGMLEYTGTTAPNSNFVLPFGQAISRTTYANYFALVGTTYGVGDGSTTFNVIDKRGRVSAGKDDMGGSAASRITNAGSSIVGTTLGANGGAENVTIAQANLPNYTLPNTLSGAMANPGGGGYFVVNNNTFVNDVEASSSANDNVPLGASGAIYTGVSVTISGSVTSGGSGTATNKMPPAIIVNYILRII